MRLSAPSQIVFIIAVILAVVAVLMFLDTIRFPAISSFWVMTIAFLVLAAGNLMRRV